MQIKLLISIIIAAFLFAGVTGVAYSGLMMGHGIDDMIGCSLLDNEMTLCNMNPLDHISAWQNMFAAIPALSTVILLLLLLALFFVLRQNRYLWLPYPSPQSDYYISHSPDQAVSDTLQRFIARGLMHPKIF